MSMARGWDVERYVRVATAVARLILLLRKIIPM